MTSRKKKLPDVGAATQKMVEYWDRALSEREEDRKVIAQYAAKENLTIREMLEAAWFKTKLDLLEPPLPKGTPMNATNAWLLWVPEILAR